MTEVAPIDAIIDGSQTAVYLSAKNIKVGTGFPADVYTTAPTEAALDVLIEGSAFAGSARISDDHKLAVALSLYAAYFTERALTLDVPLMEQPESKMVTRSEDKRNIVSDCRTTRLA